MTGLRVVFFFFFLEIISIVKTAVKYVEGCLNYRQERRELEDWSP